MERFKIEEKGKGQNNRYNKVQDKEFRERFKT